MAASSILAPHEEDKLQSYDPSGTGGGFGSGGGFTPYRPGMGGAAPGTSPMAPAPMPSVLPDSFGAGSPDNPVVKEIDAGSAAPKPAAAPPPPTNASPEVDEAKDENPRRGFAANILAGGMFQAPPELARNILLGN